MSASAEIRIRRMGAGDVERVPTLADRLAEAPHWPVSAYAAAIDPENRPPRVALVAEDCNSSLLAGFLIASLVAPEAELETIAVAPEAQRRGVGGRMLGVLVEELKVERVTDLILEVRASNRAALGFYGAVGFQQTGRRPRYYADPEEDAVRMRLKLA